MKKGAKGYLKKLAEIVGWFLFVTPGFVLTAVLLPLFEWIVRRQIRSSNSSNSKSGKRR